MKNKQPPTNAPQFPVINEPNEDSFSSFKKDPRLNTSVYQNTTRKKSLELRLDLEKQFKIFKDDESFFDALRKYKTKEHQKIITSFEDKPLDNRKHILRNLSDIADNILFVAYNRLNQSMQEKYGMPSYLNSYKQNLEAHLAIVAMGKLGGQEINYYSDLDIIFVFSHRGDTIGNVSINNHQYFVKLAQKYINTLSVMTAAGRCYQIDTELRPSGNAGTLVISYDHFIDHQMNRAEPWERQALIRARAMSTEWDFQDLLQNQIEKLAFDRPLSKHFIPYMYQIRQRVIRERAKTSDNGIDIKLGSGCLMDIEFILHYFQLKNGRLFPAIKQRPLFDVLNTLKDHDCLSQNDLKNLTEAHLTFRTVESLLHLNKKRSESFLEYNSDAYEKISERLGYSNSKSLKDLVENMKEEVRKIFENIYKKSASDRPKAERTNKRART